MTIYARLLYLPLRRTVATVETRGVLFGCIFSDQNINKQCRNLNVSG